MVNVNGKLRDLSTEISTKSKQSNANKLNMSVCLCVWRSTILHGPFETVIVCVHLYSVCVCVCVSSMCAFALSVSVTSKDRPSHSEN